MDTVAKVTKGGGRPTPVVSPETAPYWAAANEGRFIVQECRKCGKRQYHYRASCCHCWSEDVDDVDVTEGTVWTFTVVHKNRNPEFREDTPYVLALIELADGLKVLTDIVGIAPGAVQIGMKVRVTFGETAEGQRIPLFEPSPSGSEL